MNWGTGPLKLLMTTVPPNLFVILSDNLLTFLFRHVSHSQPLFSIFVTRGRDNHIINHMFLSLFFHLYLLPYFFKLGSTSLQLTAVRCLARSEGSWRGRWGVDKGEECGHCAFPVCVYLRQTERKKGRERRARLIRSCYRCFINNTIALTGFLLPLRCTRYSAALDLCLCAGGLGLRFCRVHTTLNLCFPIMSIRWSCDRHVTWSWCTLVSVWVCSLCCFSSLCLRFAE